MKPIVTSFRLSIEQRSKLDRLAKTLSTSSNAVLCKLIDNAELQPVQRVEPVAVLEIGGAKR